MPTTFQLVAPDTFDPDTDLDVNTPLTDLTGFALHVLDGDSPNVTIAAGDYLSASVSGFNPITVAGASGITIVERQKGGSWDGAAHGSFTFTFVETLQENDVILVVRQREGSVSFTAISGYSTDHDASVGDGDNIFRSRVDWLRCGSTPPTSVTVPSEGTITVCAHLIILRGANTSTLFDTTTTTNGGTETSATVDAADITTFTNGALVLAFGCYADRNGSPLDSYPTNLDLFTDVITPGHTSTTTNHTLAVGGHLKATAGAFSPGTFDFAGTSTETTYAFTLAIRPA